MVTIGWFVKRVGRHYRLTIVGVKKRLLENGIDFIEEFKPNTNGKQRRSYETHNQCRIIIDGATQGADF